MFEPVKNICPECGKEYMKLKHKQKNCSPYCSRKRGLRTGRKRAIKKSPIRKYRNKM